VGCPTTPNYNIAQSFNTEGHGIITINLNKIPKENIKLGWMEYNRDSPAYHYSIWQNEYSIFGNIPQSAIIHWER